MFLSAWACPVSSATNQGLNAASHEPVRNAPAPTLVRIVVIQTAVIQTEAIRIAVIHYAAPNVAVRIVASRSSASPFAAPPSSATRSAVIRDAAPNAVIQLEARAVTHVVPISVPISAQTSVPYAVRLVVATRSRNSVSPPALLVHDGHFADSRAAALQPSPVARCVARCSPLHHEASAAPVCSSDDLQHYHSAVANAAHHHVAAVRAARPHHSAVASPCLWRPVHLQPVCSPPVEPAGSALDRGHERSDHDASSHPAPHPAFAPRSEERRVGKECRSRWSPYH